ncbi:Uncharacterised protein [Mycobacteroides abscessus subsp. abscessus]|nr:Uncharacterised protein [Mycobacteroides abscessus subsp. abscessus]
MHAQEFTGEGDVPRFFGHVDLHDPADGRGLINVVADQRLLIVVDRLLATENADEENHVSPAAQYADEG